MFRSIRFAPIAIALFLAVESQAGVIALEDFDGTSTWSNNAAASLFADPSSPDQGLFIQAGDASRLGGDNVLFGRDLQNESGEPDFNPLSLTFDSVDVSGFTNVVASFEYDLVGFDTTDSVSYELFVDGVTADSGSFAGVAGGVPSIAGTYSYAVGTASNVSLNLVLRNDGASDTLELDNFQLTGDAVVTGVVPEPSTAMVFLMVGGWAAAVRPRRRRS